MSRVQAFINEKKSQHGRGFTTSTLAYLSVLTSVVICYALIRQPGSLIPLGNLFRNYYAGDQLSYAAYAVNVGNGDYSNSEPFTQTGSSFYPSAWYRLLGVLRQFSGIPEATLWNFAGTLFVLATITWIGILAWKLTRIWWAPLSVGVLMGIGPIASALGEQWAAGLSNGIGIWGPYGAFYTLNAEVIGLCIGVSALGISLITIVRPSHRKAVRATQVIVAFGLVGLIANVHTYAFFLSIAVFLGYWALLGINQSSTRKPLYWSLIILITVLLSGSFLREYIGELPVFGLMLASTLPGLLVLAQRRLTLSIAAGSVLVLTALPQLLITTSGILSNNEFLTFRVAQSSNRGLSLWDFVTVGAPIVVLFLFNSLALRAIQAPYLKSALYAWFISFALLTFNNFWGFGQEPYRFWINGVFFGIAIMSISTPICIRVLTDPDDSRILPRMAAIGTVLLVTLSLWNVGGYRIYVHEVGMIDLESPQLKSISSLSALIQNEAPLVFSEPCITPELLKLTSGQPVAYYNKGMAWPDNKLAIDALLEMSAYGVLDSETLRKARVTHLFTDSTCSTEWTMNMPSDWSKVSAVPYEGDEGIATVSLWEVN